MLFLDYRPSTAFGLLVAINFPRTLNYVRRMNEIQTTLRRFLRYQDVVAAFANIERF